MQDLRFWEFAVALLTILWFIHRSAGRLTPRVVLAPLLFLVTRLPVLVAWAAGAIGMFWLIVSSAQSNGKDPFADLPLLVGLSVFCGLGVAPLTVGPVFFAVRAFGRAPAVELEPGERVLEELSANHFLGGEARGGKLLLTDRRIVFRPHRFNVQLDTWAVPRSEVTGARAEGLRMLVLSTRDGAEHWLVAMHPGEARDAAAGGRVAAWARASTRGPPPCRRPPCRSARATARRPTRQLASRARPRRWLRGGELVEQRPLLLQRVVFCPICKIRAPSHVGRL